MDLEHALAVGFDLDMTLLDTRPGIAEAYRQLTARTGTPIDVDLVVNRLGPPLRTELANWFPAADIEDMVTLYRSLYVDHAIAPAVPLPGAAEAVAAIRAAGGRVAVVTSKLGRLAVMHLAHVNIEVDAVFGDVFAEGKAPAIAEFGARAYVGDHVADMRAGRTAGVFTIGVPSGPCSAGDLHAAGADAVVGSLLELPATLGNVR